MNIIPRKFYMPNDEVAGSGETPETTESLDVTLFCDSKFRRETSNFKINVTFSVELLQSQTPMLVKQLDPGMKREEFLGLVIDFVGNPVDDATYIISFVTNTQNGKGYELVALTYDGPKPILYYNPANGKLSVGGVMEDADGGGNGIVIRVDIVRGGIPIFTNLNPGLLPEDFSGAKVKRYADGELIYSGVVTSTKISRATGAILLTIDNSNYPVLAYVPSTGEVRAILDGEITESIS